MNKPAIVHDTPISNGGGGSSTMITVQMRMLPEGQMYSYPIQRTDDEYHDSMAYPTLNANIELPEGFKWAIGNRTYILNNGVFRVHTKMVYDKLTPTLK